MPHYMFHARYSTDALKAMVDTPQDREAAAKIVVESVGGTLHAMYFCFGDDDVIAIIEAPDDQAMAACALAVGSSGAFSSGGTTKLMTSAEAMAAMKQAQEARASYTPATG